MIVTTRKVLNSPNYEILVTLTQEMMDAYAHDAVRDMSIEVGRKIAEQVFKANKKKIISAVNLDLVIAEVEKNLLEKVKKHSIPHRE